MPPGTADGQTPNGTTPAPSPEGSLGRAAASGTLWLTAQKWAARLSGLATIAILTRLIAPEEFGVVAAAVAVTPFVLLLADLGFSTYIVQAEKVDERTLSTGFWFSLTAGLVLGGGLVAAAPLIALAFSLPEAVPVLRAMSISVLLVVAASVPTALLRRKMAFKLLAFQTTTAALVAQGAAIVLAFRGAGAWALVVQLIVAQGLGGILAWRAARWRPRFQFSTSQFATMTRFGSKVVSVELVATIRGSAEAAIISSVLGPAALGYLSIAQRLIQVTQDLGAAALVPVATVVFSRMRDSADRLRAAYIKALRIAYAAVSPILTFVAVGGPLLVPVIFGEGWEESVPVAQALAIAAILTLGAMLDHGLHYGVGRPGRWLGYAVLIDALTVAVTAVAAPHGLQWVAVGFVAVAFTATVARWVLVGRLVELPSRRLAAVFGSAGIAVVGSAGAGWWVSTFTTDLPPLVALAILAATIAVVHVVLVRLVSRSVLRDVVDLLPLPGRLAARLGR